MLRSFASRPRLVLAAGLLVLTGCLPSSQRDRDRSVTAADSASAVLAASVPVDTLAEVWTARAPEADPMTMPTSLAWSGDGLVVVETLDGSVRRFGADGAPRGRIDLPGEGIPYLAGAWADTVAVHARARGEIWWAVPGQGVVRRAPAPAEATHALAGPGLLAVRVGGGPSRQAAEVVRLDDRGAVLSRHPVTGPDWRAVGRLRAWGDTLVALSGYRPVVDLLAPGATALDTLALDGFDTPQAPRSAQFMRGDVDEPPLLTSSADALGDRLYVLNMRTDHVRIDVYGRDGRLERLLVSPPRPETDVALDLAVREGAEGAVEFAVLWGRPPGLMSSPASRVVLYRL